MIEKQIVLQIEKPVHFFGSRHKNLQLIQKLLPNVKIISRGNLIKIQGNEDEVLNAENKIAALIKIFEANEELNEQKI